MEREGEVEEEKDMAMEDERILWGLTVSERNGSVEVEEEERERRAMAGGFQRLENLGEGSSESILSLWAGL